ncbi:hypothetical protein BOX15_Mlig030786g1, partial [Macrostomum lignano]
NSMALLGVPSKLLHEAEGHVITCEMDTGEMYRGMLVEAEENMNCQMSDVTVTFRDGRVAHLENIFLRGSKARFFILPDMLKNAPMFKRTTGTKGLGMGRGKTMMHRGRGGFRGGRGGY